MTEQERTISQNAGRAVGLAKNWIDAVEGRSRALILSAILALPPIGAWAYGVSNVTPARCAVGGTFRWDPCIRMSEPKSPFPGDWNGLLMAAFAIAFLCGAMLVLRPQNKNARLVFSAASVLIAAVAGLQLVTLMAMPNGTQFLAFNSAWFVVPGGVGAAALFAAISSRS